jgi:hypothetical protein
MDVFSPGGGHASLGLSSLGLRREDEEEGGKEVEDEKIKFDQGLGALRQPDFVIRKQSLRQCSSVAR